MLFRRFCGSPSNGAANPWLRRRCRLAMGYFLVAAPAAGYVVIVKSS
jgi:hypothetical protein